MTTREFIDKVVPADETKVLKAMYFMFNSLLNVELTSDVQSQVASYSNWFRSSLKSVV